MKHNFLVFPAGSTGVALLLIRASVSISLLFPPYGSIPPRSATAVACAVLAVAVGIGVFTRVVALVAALVGLAVAAAAAGPPSLAFMTFALQSTALALIGPGAVSVDARRFGRKTLHLGR